MNFSEEIFIFDGIYAINILIIFNQHAKKDPKERVRNVKKRAVCAALLCLAIVAGGCAKKDEYVKLGQYKGLEVTVESYEVTDEEMETQIQRLLQDKATSEEVTGRPVQDGDIVNIDYEGLLDGEAFEGGSAEAFDLTIGSGSFIAGFEEGLIGAGIGESKSLNLTFPDPYEKNADLAGKPVVFNVTVNSIKQPVTPEFNDAFVQTLGDQYKTVEDYKSALKTSLEEQKKQSVESDKMTSLRQLLYDNSEIVKYPEGALDDYIKEMTDYYTNYAASVELTLAEYLEQYMSMDEAQFQEEAKAVAEQNVGMELIINAIAEKEKITLSDDEYKELCAQYTEEFGFESEEQFLEYYGGEEDVKMNMLSDKVMEFVAENAVEKAA